MNKNTIFFVVLTLIFFSFTTINAQFYYTRYVENKGNPGGLNTEADASTAGWTEIVSGNNSNNFWSSIQTIPFDFEFFGNNVTQFKVSQNGLVTFDASASALPDANTNLPSADLPDSTIACFWDNFTGTPPTGTNDAIQTKIFGSAPNRQLWIRWFSFEYGNPGFSYSYFALVLEESSNSIYMVDMNYFYGSITSTVGIQLDNSTVIQNSDSTITFALGGTSAPDNDYYEFYIPKTNDVTVNNVSFSSFQGFPGVPVTISAEIANLGTAAQSGFDIKYSVDDGSSSTYNYSGTINSQEILTIDFPTTWTPAAIEYPIIKVYTELTGDENVSNDTSEATIEITYSDTLNFFEDFTTYNGNPTSIGWYGINDRDFGSFIPDINDGVWTYADFGNNPSFSRSVSNNLYNDFINNDWLISPALNMTTTAPGNQLKFDISVTPFEETDSTGIDPGDTIFVVASTNGITWSRNNILTYFTSNDVIMPTGTPVNLDLTAYDSEISLYIGFYAYDAASTGGDYNVYIDNFFVGTLPQTDMEITSFQSVPSYGVQDSLVNFIVQVKNFGSDPVPADTFDLFVNGSLTSSIEYPALSSGESNFINVSYSATTLGENLITAAIRMLPGDINPANDTLSTSIPISFYFEDFETGIVGTPGTLPTGWTNETDDDWDWYVDKSGTTSGSTGPWVDHTLGTSAGIYLYTEATNHEHETFHVTSPVIDLSSLTSPALTFWYHMNGGAMGDLHVDVHDGISWHLDVREVLVGQQQLAQTDPWLMGTADLSGFGNNIQLRFRGITGSWASDMAIDDISITEASAILTDVMSRRIESPFLSLVPVTQTSITTNMEVATSFYNQGIANTGDITLEIYDSTGAVVYTDGDIGVTIPAFGSSSFGYISDASDANTGETYNAAIFASNFTDPNSSNDTSWAYPVTFGNQMGYDQSNWDVNLTYQSPGGRTMFASRFDLLDDDVLTSVLIAIGTGNATDSFSVDLYSSDADTPSVMLSRIYRGTLADVGAPAFVTFEAPYISLTAGDYWIVLDLDATSGYPLGADRNAFKPTYYPNHFAMHYETTNWIMLDNSSFGSYTPLIRIGLSEANNLSIAEARADNDNDFVPDLLDQEVVVSGIITSPNFSSGMDYYLQDSTAGINLFSFTNYATLNVGDEVQVTGTIDQFNGKTEIIPSDTSGIVILSTGNPTPVAQMISISDIGEDYESELIQLNSVWLVDASQWPSAGSNANVDITDGVDTLVVRIDKESDIDENDAPSGIFNLKGIGGQHDGSTPPDGGYQIQPRFYTDFIPEPIVLFKDDFDTYTAGTQLTVQNSTDWSTWSGTPGTGEDPYISDSQAYNGSNSVNIITDNDLVHPISNYVSGVFTISFELYVPSGTVAYFNTLQDFAGTNSEWGMQVYFRSGGAGDMDAGGATSATFTYSYDTWLHNEVLVDLDNDTAVYFIDESRIHGWKWSGGTSGNGTLNQLGGSNFYGGGPTGTFNFYVDNYCLSTNDSTILGVDGPETANLPTTFDLKQNYPNPFNPTTKIKYQLPKKSDIKIVIYNILGQAVRTLVDKPVDAGYQEAIWDGLNDFGNKVATGIYFYRMETKDFVKSKKMILMK